MKNRFMNVEGVLSDVTRILHDGHPVVTFRLTTDDEVFSGEMTGKFSGLLEESARVRMKGTLRKSFMYGGRMQQSRVEVFYPEWCEPV